MHTEDPVNTQNKLRKKMSSDERLMAVPKSDIEMLILKANIELLQRVNLLVNLIETEIEKAQEK